MAQFTQADIITLLKKRSSTSSKVIKKDEKSSLEQYNKSLELLQNVSLGVSVELGKVNMKMGELLNLTEGSIIKIDKNSQEPVEVLVNERLIATGQVVVINEKFGVSLIDLNKDNVLHKKIRETGKKRLISPLSVEFLPTDAIPGE